MTFALTCYELYDLFLFLINFVVRIMVQCVRIFTEIILFIKLVLS